MCGSGGWWCRVPRIAAPDPPCEAKGDGWVPPGAYDCPPMADPTDHDDGAVITRDDVVHVARLARLRLADDELDLFTDQLAAVLAHARDVEALDVTDVPPMSHPYPLVNVLRDDVVGPTADRAEVLASAPAVEDGRFRVPPILGEEP
jgi:aspartyl-tRNA(Asn)/glutamyl-tRNA(Gln) amidotransferase subunit C